MTITAEPLEQIITEAVLYRLDTPELASALAGRAPNPAHSTAIRSAIDNDVAQLEELTQLYAARSITAVEWIQARSTVETRLNDARRQLAQAAGAGAINDYIGKGEALRSQWSTLTLDRQRTIVRAVLTHVVIKPGRFGVHRVDPNRVDPFWRL